MNRYLVKFHVGTSRIYSVIVEALDIDAAQKQFKLLSKPHWKGATIVLLMGNQSIFEQLIIMGHLNLVPGKFARYEAAKAKLIEDHVDEMERWINQIVDMGDE